MAHIIKMSSTCLVLILFINIANSVKPPGYVDKPKDVDPNPPNYDFQYKIDDNDSGASQAHQEKRQGEHTQGHFSVELPKKSSIQDVQYSADDWGYHPLVRYSLNNPHSSSNTKLVLGTEAQKLDNIPKETTPIAPLLAGTVLPAGTAVNSFIHHDRQNGIKTLHLMKPINKPALVYAESSNAAPIFIEKSLKNQFPKNTILQPVKESKQSLHLLPSGSAQYSSEIQENDSRSSVRVSLGRRNNGNSKIDRSEYSGTFGGYISQLEKLPEPQSLISETSYEGKYGSKISERKDVSQFVTSTLSPLLQSDDENKESYSKLVSSTQDLVSNEDLLNINRAVESDIQELRADASILEEDNLKSYGKILNPKFRRPIGAGIVSIDEDENNDNGFTKPIVVADIGGSEETTTSTPPVQYSTTQNILLDSSLFSTTQNTLETISNGINNINNIYNSENPTSTTIIVTPRPVSQNFLAPLTVGLRLVNSNNVELLNCPDNKQINHNFDNDNGLRSAIELFRTAAVEESNDSENNRNSETNNKQATSSQNTNVQRDISQSTGNFNSLNELSKDVVNNNVLNAQQNIIQHLQNDLKNRLTLQNQLQLQNDLNQQQQQQRLINHNQDAQSFQTINQSFDNANQQQYSNVNLNNNQQDQHVNDLQSSKKIQDNANQQLYQLGAQQILIHPQGQQQQLAAQELAQQEEERHGEDVKRESLQKQQQEQNGLVHGTGTSNVAISTILVSTTPSPESGPVHISLISHNNNNQQLQSSNSGHTLQYNPSLDPVAQTDIRQSVAQGHQQFITSQIRNHQLYNVPLQNALPHIHTVYPVQVEKIVEKPVPVPYEVEKKVPYPVHIEKIVEKPVEVTKYVDKPYPVGVKVPQPVAVPIHVHHTYPVDRVVHKNVPYPVHVEKIVEKQVPVEVKVPYPVEKVVEKIVDRPYEVTRYVNKPYPVEKPVPYPVQVEKIVEKKVPVPIEVKVPYPVEKIVEKKVHVPVEVKVPYPVDRIVEKPIHVAVPYNQGYINHNNINNLAALYNANYLYNLNQQLINHNNQHAQYNNNKYPSIVDSYFRRVPTQLASPSSNYAQTTILAAISNNNNHHYQNQRGFYEPYIGPVPLASSINSWNIQDAYNQNQLKYRRFDREGKGLRIEYGFKPPLVPSLEIDLLGRPIHKQ